MTDEYQNQVSNIIAAQPRNSTYKPTNPIELFVKRRRTPQSLADLAPIERQQLAKMWNDVTDFDAWLAAGVTGGEDEEYPVELEVAEVVDDKGVVRYRLWGMNYGAIFLMAADSLECIAFAAQHDLEHWHADQREVFWAMDRAMMRKDHGFQQGMKFCWWEEKCWVEIADKPRGTVGSEPYIRKQFAD